MKYSPSAFGIGQLSGSTGGTTASRNRFGSYFRARVMPVNPRSPVQTLRREVLSGLSSNWRTLSDVERNGWDALADQITKSDSLGNTYTPTGLQTYVGNNSLRIWAEEDMTDIAPILDNPPIITILAATIEAEEGSIQTMTLAFDLTPLENGQRVAAYATGAISAGRKYIRPSEYRLLEISPENQASPYNILPAYADIFSDVGDPGDRIAIKLVPLSPNFFRGTPIEILATVVAPTP